MSDQSAYPEEFRFKHPDGDKGLRELVLEKNIDEEANIVFLEPGFLDEAIVGQDELSGSIIYDIDKLIDAYRKSFAQDEIDNGREIDREQILNDAIDQVYNDTCPQIENPSIPGTKPILLSSL